MDGEKYFDLTIKGTYRENTLRLKIVKETAKTFTVLIGDKKLRIPRSIPFERTYRIPQINKLHATLRLLAEVSWGGAEVAWGAEVAVTVIDEYHTLLTQRCSVMVANRNDQSCIERKVDITVPKSWLTKDRGVTYVSARLVSKEHLSKHEYLVRVTTPLLEVLITDIKAAVSQIQSQDKQEYARRVKAGEIGAGEYLEEEAISPSTESLALVIQGKYCSGEIRREVIKKSGKWYQVSTPEGTAWLPQFLFTRPVYKVGKIDKLITFLKKIARDSLDATALVWPTTIKPTVKSRKCLVDVVYEDAWKIIQRTLIMTLPEYSITEKDGMSYAPSKIVKGNLGKYEKPKYASTPSFDGMIAEIETLVNEIRATDWQELKKRCPPDEFDWSKSFKPWPGE